MKIKGIVATKKLMPSEKGWIIKLEGSDTTFSIFDKKIADRIETGKEINANYEIRDKYNNITKLVKIAEPATLTREIHLTEESIRIGALRIAKKYTNSPEACVKIAKEVFEPYIRTGE